MPRASFFRVRLATDSHRVTQFELFFDLVFVFALTQVTGFIADTHTGLGIVQGVVTLALLWWSWSAYAWLGNQVHADLGVVRLGMVVAMIAVFMIALAIPEAWHDEPGGLDAAIVLAVAYIVVASVHQTLSVTAARGDPALRHQLALNLLPRGSGAALLLAGTTLEGWARTAAWATALGSEAALTYATSMRARGWRINSIRHWVERHGLVIILALGESIVAIGVGASGIPLDSDLLIAAVLGVVLATAMWWLYFDVSADAAERELDRHDAELRVRVAIESYSYLHFLLIAGIVIAAVGIEEVLADAGDGEPLGSFAAGCLSVGSATYLVGQVLAWWRVHRAVKVQRLVAGAVLLALWPVTTPLHPLAALALVTAVLVLLAAHETVRYGSVRAELADARP